MSDHLFPIRKKKTDYISGSSMAQHLVAQVVKERRDGGDSKLDKVDQARELAKKGNPFPLIALQWPELVVKDEADAKFFEGEIGDELNPCLKIDPWQRGILNAGFDVGVGEIFVKGCTGAGKGFSAGLLINLIYDVYPTSRVFITSQSQTHATNNLFGAEFSIRRQKMRFPQPGELLKQKLFDHPMHLVTVLNPSPHGDGEAFSGMHAGEGHTVFFFDEASAVPEINYENCLKNATKVIALSNPRVTEGWFRDGYRSLQGEGTREERHQRENETGYCVGRLGKRYCVSVPGSDCTNVRFGLLKKPVAPRRGIEIEGTKYGPAERISEEHFEKIQARVPGQIDLAQYQSILDTSPEQWQVECFAHAMFPSENPVRQVILYSWLDVHMKAWSPQIPVTCFGLDVARSKSGDSTCLTVGGIKGCRAIHRWVDDSNTRHVQKILKIASQYGIDLREGREPICIDMGGGYGAAVYDRLLQLGCNVIPFDPAGTPVVYPNLYANQRAEGYMLLGRRLDPSDNWSGWPWALPQDEAMAEELTCPTKIPTRGGVQWKLESKDDISKRLGRSPDTGDAIVCLWRAVFNQYDLVDKMNEGVDNLIISAGYAEEKADPLEEESPELADMEEEDIELPDPIATVDSQAAVDDILEAFGVQADSLGEDDDEYDDDPADITELLSQRPPTPRTGYDRYLFGD